MNEIITIDKVKSDKSIQDITTTIAGYGKRVEGVSVRKEDDLVPAIDLTKEIKVMLGTIEDIRKQYSEPHRLFVTAVNAFFKPFKDKLLNLTITVRGKIYSYQASKVKRAEKSNAPAPIMCKSTGQATGFMKKPWVFETEDLKKVPRDYLTLDYSKVNGAIRAGLRNIPGLKIFQKDQLNIR